MVPSNVAVQQTVPECWDGFRQNRPPAGMTGDDIARAEAEKKAKKREEEIANETEYPTFAANEIIYSIGDDATDFYIIT